MKKQKETKSKTYAVNGLCEASYNIKYGKNHSITLRFANGTKTQYGMKPAIYITNSVMEQAIIENSKLFKEGTIYLLRESVTGKVEVEMRGPNETDEVKTTNTAKDEEGSEGNGNDANAGNGSSEDNNAGNGSSGDNNAGIDRHAGTSVNTVSDGNGNDTNAGNGSSEKTYTTVDEAVNNAEGSGMVFDDLSSAQDYLIETFGVKRTEIRSKKGVIEFGNSHGVNIIISD